MHVHIKDYYGVIDWFKVIETGKAPEGYGHKVSVVFINSSGMKERSVVNSDHIQFLEKDIKKARKANE
jgi:hypothetical protein